MNNKKSNNNQLLMTLLKGRTFIVLVDRKSTRLNSSHMHEICKSRMPSSA